MRSAQVFRLLRDYESPNVTFLEPDGSWPCAWERARGVHVWDNDDKKYLDLTAAFGVAAAGHANARVVKAGQRQMSRLLHAMGDVHPHQLKAQLARELSRLTFERWASFQPTPASLRGKTIFCNSGFEAVEAALKTARMATGKPGVIAFERAYHGLGYGALNATHRPLFRSPFQNQIRAFGQFVPFPAKPGDLEPCLSSITAILRRSKIGALLVEPVQGRGGVHVPPIDFLPRLRQVCDEFEVLLILDEIYTGFGRTGCWFACEHSEAIPDIICLGKALTGGFPLSACVAKASLMDAAWPVSQGEAIHTSTYLGHPVGCAMALAQIKEIRRLKLVSHSALLGLHLLALLAAVPVPSALVASSRGLGLMAGLELCLRDGSPATSLSMRVIKTMLKRGFVLLPEGEYGNIISFTPPLTITVRQLEQTVENLSEVLANT